MPTRTIRTRMDDQRKEHMEQKRPSQMNCRKQLQADRVFTYDVENTNDTNKGRDLLFANKP